MAEIDDKIKISELDEASEITDDDYFVVDNGEETKKVNATKGKDYFVPDDILQETDVVNNTDSTATNLPLSANMGKSLQDQVNNLKNIGRFLAIWDCSTGLPLSEPEEMPYEYHTGDYFRVGTVGNVNYKPYGSEYDGTASTTLETGDVEVGWVYYYDGTQWLAQSAGGGGLVQDIQINGTSILDSDTGVANFVSGTNVKTINNTPVLGSGNIDITPMPDGGTANQMLVKNSNTDGDASWKPVQPIYTGESVGGDPAPIDADLLSGKALQTILNMIYPPGSLYTVTGDNTPDSILGIGVWTLVAEKLPIGKNVFGNGTGLALVKENSLGVFKDEDGTLHTASPIGTRTGGSCSVTPNNNTAIGVPTKEQLDNGAYPYSYTGLEMESITVNIYQRVS